MNEITKKAMTETEKVRFFSQVMELGVKLSDAGFVKEEADSFFLDTVKGGIAWRLGVPLEVITSWLEFAKEVDEWTSEEELKGNQGGQVEGGKEAK